MPFLSGNICFHRITTFHSTFVSTTFQVPIERDDGCAQMMCKNCRHVFCWFCLASLDDDFMLRHYDSGLPRSTFSRLKRFNIFVVGPCRSRLGHSRISVVWHRTQVRINVIAFLKVICSIFFFFLQVVSAFLGLGVLFLVTSPLLLLASPCFFCWRHHHSQNKESSIRINAESSTAFVPSPSQEHI